MLHTWEKVVKILAMLIIVGSGVTTIYIIVKYYHPLVLGDIKISEIAQKRPDAIFINDNSDRADVYLLSSSSYRGSSGYVYTTYADPKTYKIVHTDSTADELTYLMRIDKKLDRLIKIVR